MSAVVYGKPFNVVFEGRTNAGCVDGQFFIAPFPCQVTAVAYDNAIAGDDSGAVNLQLRKLTGTQAITSGTAMLTNNTNAGFNCKGTAQTRQTGALSLTVGNLQLAAGDKLAGDFAGVVTTLAGVVMEVTLVPIA